MPTNSSISLYVCLSATELREVTWKVMNLLTIFGLTRGGMLVLVVSQRARHGDSINVSTERLKWRPMPDKTREFTLRHNVQRHLGQSEDWII